MSCAIHGLFYDSLHYHPMGMLILLLLGVIAGQSLLPKVWRNRLKHRLQAQAFAFNTLYLAFVGLFVIYGSARAFLHFAQLVHE